MILDDLIPIAQALNNTPEICLTSKQWTHNITNKNGVVLPLKSIRLSSLQDVYDLIGI
jgi:hypothetical protein